MEMCGCLATGKQEAKVSGVTESNAAKDPDADTVSMASDTTSPVTEVAPSPVAGQSTESMAPSADVVAWTLLARQLEDLTDVDCFLKLRPLDHRHMVNHTEDLRVSVAALLEGGKGNNSRI